MVLSMAEGDDDACQTTLRVSAGGSWHRFPSSLPARDCSLRYIQSSGSALLSVHSPAYYSARSWESPSVPSGHSLLFFPSMFLSLFDGNHEIGP